MLLRLFAVLLVLAVTFALTSSVALAEEKTTTAEGTVVKIEKSKLTIEDKDKKEHTCTVAKDAKVTCDGKECKLKELKKGVKVKVTVEKDMATKIEATTK